MVQQAPDEIRKLAGITDIYYAGFSNNGLKAIISHKKALRADLIGDVAGARTARQEAEGYRIEATQYETLAQYELNKISSQVDLLVGKLQSDISRTQQEVVIALVSIALSLSVFLVVFISIFTRKTIIRPLKLLVNAAQSIGRGEFETRVNLRTDGELLILANSFDQMAEDIGRSREELRQYQNHLEELVNERTVNLEATNENLQKEIVERTRAQNELELARDTAFAASRAKSEFLACMSHEIRTPMNTIIGMSCLLSETQLNQEQQEYVQSFSSASENLLGLIDNILDLSKIAAGELVLEQVSFDLEHLVESNSRVLALLAHEKGLELNVGIDPNVPTNLSGDPIRLRQIITNLISNAIKFTKSGGVSLFVDKNPESDETGAVRFRIVDTGIGIPPDKLESILKISPRLTLPQLGNMEVLASVWLSAGGL